MEFQTLRTEVSSEGIGIITLNRPERRNALSIQNEPRYRLASRNGKMRHRSAP